jgi:hypothetical protein
MGHVLADSRNKHAKGNERELRNAVVATDLYGIQSEKSPNLPKLPKRPAGHPIQKVPPKAELLTVAGG